ncbi:MAG: hypothetical protein ACTSSG_14575 [Candidatus Heimdallarchaeaceae archaeon]
MQKKYRVKLPDKKKAILEAKTAGNPIFPSFLNRKLAYAIG